MRIFLIHISLLLLLIFYSCSNVDCTTKEIDKYYLSAGGTYFFKMEDKDKKPILEGIIYVRYRTKLNMSGTYEITKIYNESYPGIKSMMGTFTAQESEDDNTVYLNTNPKIADDNIIFEFNLMKNKIEGKWYRTTLKGKIDEGDLSGHFIEKKS
ncbi:MAG: hypothetical protein N2490_09330 [Ignavibacteria bacterium]|nr:hypothetical protein [Ignavibacteria bacterium]